MKKMLMILLCIVVTVFPVAALADELVVISLAETPEPVSPAQTAPPTPEPQPVNYSEYEWTQGDIDTVAQVYWQWCNTSREKADITMLIMNRVMDTSGLFRDNVEDVVTQSGEFNISTARCSDRNRDFARANLNRCMTEYLIGGAGVNVPRTALYADRVDGVLTFYDDNTFSNIVWRCK